MSNLTTHNRKWTTRAGLVFGIVSLAILRLVVVLFNVLRQLLISVEIQHTEEQRLHDSYLTGELNHRTGRLDAGTDPYGWYDD